MAKADRTGNRKSRKDKISLRVPCMGYYIVITDAKGTEPNYFKGLHSSLPNEVKDKLVIRVVETMTSKMIEKCKELTAYEAQYRIPWIIFDRDQVANFDDIIANAENAGINVGWSNPCFEIWMHAYFGNMPKTIDSTSCCNNFTQIFERKVGQEYDKSDKNIYRKICCFGNEIEAIKIAKQRYNHLRENGYNKPSEMSPCSKVYELVEEIKGKVQNC